MPAATPNRIRRQIVDRRSDGASYAAIARELALPYITVRKIDQHYRRTGHLEPDYARCKHTEVRKAQAIYEQAVALKRQHPGWGAGLIWVELAEVWPESALPSVRTLQRWFQRAGLVQPRPRPREPGPVARGTTAHAVWAMDAKEQIRLPDGQGISWLTISDEASGAILSATIFPPLSLEPGRSTGRAPVSASDDGAVG